MNKICDAIIFASVLFLCSSELFSMANGQSQNTIFPFGLRWLRVVNRTHTALARIDFFCEPENIENPELIQWGSVERSANTVFIKPVDCMKAITLLVHTADKKFAQLGPIVFNGAKPYLVLFALNHGIRARLIEPLLCMDYDSRWIRIP